MQTQLVPSLGVQVKPPGGVNTCLDVTLRIYPLRIQVKAWIQFYYCVSFRMVCGYVKFINLLTFPLCPVLCCR